MNKTKIQIQVSLLQRALTSHLLQEAPGQVQIIEYQQLQHHLLNVTQKDHSCPRLRKQMQRPPARITCTVTLNSKIKTINTVRFAFHLGLSGLFRNAHPNSDKFICITVEKKLATLHLLLLQAMKQPQQSGSFSYLRNSDPSLRKRGQKLMEIMKNFDMPPYVAYMSEFLEKEHEDCVVRSSISRNFIHFACCFKLKNRGNEKT